MTRKGLITTLTFLLPQLGAASPIACNITEQGSVAVTMETPHPENALIYRPDGKVVWLQTSTGLIHPQNADVSELKTWVLSPESTGTVWAEGHAMVQPIFNGNGRYRLYIADNLETESENTRFIECFFVIDSE